MSPELDERLVRLKTELDDHARIARYLGLDFERPIRSLGDGYPENAIAWVGKITERLLKRLWRHHRVPGSPGGKTLKDLINGCKPHIRSHRVVEALHDIQRLRNRSAHDGYQVADEDGLIAVRGCSTCWPGTPAPAAAHWATRRRGSPRRWRRRRSSWPGCT